MYRTLAPIFLSLVIALSALGGGVVISPAAHAADQEKITNPKIGKPLKEAKEASDKKLWEQAQAKIEIANAVEKKTPFEQAKIDEFLSYVLLQQHKYPEAAKVYEERLNSGRGTPGEVQELLLTLIRLNYQMKNYAKATEFGDRWIKGGGTDVDMQVLVGQAHYVLKDYKNAVTVMQTAIQSAQKAGKPVEENWLNIVRSAYINLDDAAGTTKTLEQLVRYFPKSEYWDALLDSLVRKKNTDPVEINLYRLMRQVGVLKQPGEYMDLAQMLNEAGVPGEAQRVMEAGYTSKVFDTTDKAKADRYTRLLNAVKTSAAADLKSLPAAEKEAQKAATGQTDVALGLAYASFEHYDKAVDSLTHGLQRGGVKDPDQARMVLGISYLKLGHKADAAKAFEQIKADSQLAEIARLWTLYARSTGS